MGDLMGSALRERLEVLLDQDECLIAITNGKRPPNKRLLSLPPRRAVLMCRVALKAGLVNQEEVDKIVEEAGRVKGFGKLEVGLRD